MRTKLEVEKYGKEELAEAVKYYLDNTGTLLTYANPMSDSGFQVPSEMTKQFANSVAKHVVESIQQALVDGKRVYFPEIGYLEVITKKKGTNMFNLATKSLEPLDKDKHRIKVKASDEMIRKLNHEE
jgi:nucleoid DNA-binding protein